MNTWQFWGTLLAGMGGMVTVAMSMVVVKLHNDLSWLVGLSLACGLNSVVALVMRYFIDGLKRPIMWQLRERDYGDNLEPDAPIFG